MLKKSLQSSDNGNVAWLAEITHSPGLLISATVGLNLKAQLGECPGHCAGTFFAKSCVVCSFVSEMIIKTLPNHFHVQRSFRAKITVGLNLECLTFKMVKTQKCTKWVEGTFLHIFASLLSSKYQESWSKMGAPTKSSWCSIWIKLKLGCTGVSFVRWRNQ